VPGGALDHDLAAREANDRGDDAERLLAAQQHRPLLDVHLDVDIGPVRGAQAPAEAALFVTERNDADRRVDSLGRLDAGEHAEHAVVPAAVRHRVEMRTGPHARVPARAEEVSRGVDFHRQPGRAHPAGRELVRTVFLRRVADAIAERVDGLDPFEQAHERSLHEKSIRCQTPKGV